MYTIELMVILTKAVVEVVLGVLGPFRDNLHLLHILNITQFHQGFLFGRGLHFFALFFELIKLLLGDNNVLRFQADLE